jgi:hypothetical protein
MRTSHSSWIWVILIILFLTACSSVISQKDISLMSTSSEKGRISTSPPSYSIPGWNQLLPFDGIEPIYDPQFIPAEQAFLEGSELIMGVSWQGEAKAYPVSVLRGREMVNDEMAGVPYLVSW